MMSTSPDETAAVMPDEILAPRRRYNDFTRSPRWPNSAIKSRFRN
jgi:hypothetical protein